MLCFTLYLTLYSTINERNLSVRLNVASLASFTSVEEMVHPNQVTCDVCGCKCDAHKGIKLRSLPAILTLSLNRFTYDWQRDVRVKNTDRFEFPTTLDMLKYCHNPTFDQSNPDSTCLLSSLPHNSFVCCHCCLFCCLLVVVVFY
jgi:ubiquitin C-terminal hydrolase